jgi:hypothetical protein
VHLAASLGPSVTSAPVHMGGLQVLAPFHFMFLGGTNLKDELRFHDKNMTRINGRLRQTIFFSQLHIHGTDLKITLLCGLSIMHSNLLYTLADPCWIFLLLRLKL